MAGKQNDSLTGSNTASRPGDPLDLATSVAGEEDPGASIDLAVPRGVQPPMAPGDEAPAGTPSTGENVCPECGGKLRKVWGAVGVVFKGGGFYRTDSRSGSSSSVPAASDSGSSEKKSGSTSGPTTGSKPAAAATSTAAADGSAA